MEGPEVIDLIKDPVAIALVVTAVVVLIGPALLKLIKPKKGHAAVIKDLLAIRDRTPDIKEEVNRAIQKLLEL